MVKIDLIKEWFRKADNDILNMENNLKAEKVPTDTVCFHAQQAVEKYLKAWLSFQNIEFEYAHDLVYLTELALQKDEEFKQLLADNEKLNDFAVKVRYPYYDADRRGSKRVL